MASLRVLETPDAVRQWVRERQRFGQRVALVPTMGFLHDGHLSLMREGLARADVVAATIFVNPTQFGPKEDLSRYPRDLPGDLQKCESAGVSVVYAPTPSTMYPSGYQTSVDVERSSQGLDGDRRPGHFRGVATVVTKLLGLFRPDVALFGEKDFQQLQVIRALNRDLELGVDIVGMPTIRESDGLAMSSRNSYLSATDRAKAVALSKGLFAARDAVRAGETRVAPLVKLAQAALAEAQVREDYVDVRDADTWAPLTELTPGSAPRMLVAGFLGTTRLIDNLALR